jgi:hypothetical protein
MIRKREPVYQALWAGPCDFDEVLISPVMIQDHMPDNMLKALNKVSEQALLLGSMPASLVASSSLGPAASRSPSVIRPGTYEPLEEVHEVSVSPPSLLPRVDNGDAGAPVVGVDDFVIRIGGDEADAGSRELAKDNRGDEVDKSSLNTTLIEVDVEVHQRNEIETRS